MNNAGTMELIAPPDWLSAGDYRSQCEVNLFGPIDVTMTFLPLVKKTSGRIVNMSSNFGLVSNPIFAPYCVSKFGIEAFTDSLRYGRLSHLSRCDLSGLYNNFIHYAVFIYTLSWVNRL